MSRGRLNAVLAAALAGAWALIVLLRPDRARHNFRLLPQMVDSLAFDSQSGALPSRDPERAGLPPDGTIPRGLALLAYAAAPQDAERAGRELASPLKATPVDAARGQVVFATFCFPCHGVQGTGDGPVARRGFPAPPSLLDAKAAALGDGRIFHIITYGQGDMPAYASQISRSDRWRAVLHVRALQRAAAGGRTDP